MADNKNTRLCPKPGYCRFATRCKKVEPKIRKKLDYQGHTLVCVELAKQDSEEDQKLRAEVEEILKEMGYILVNEKEHLWRLELEKSKVELDIFEERQECPKF